MIAALSEFLSQPKIESIIYFFLLKENFDNYCSLIVKFFALASSYPELLLASIEFISNFVC